MKKLFLTVIVAGAAFGLSTASFAQAAGPKGPGQGQGQRQGQGGQQGQRQGARLRMNQEILAKLKLTAKQKDQIKALDEKQRTKMQDLRKSLQGKNLTREQMREKFQPVQKAYMDGLKKILTAQQFQQYEKLRDEAIAKMRQGGGRPGSAGPGGAPAKGGAKGGGGTKKGGGL